MEFLVYRFKLIVNGPLLAAWLLFAAPAFAQDWSPVFEKSKASVPLLFMSSGYCAGSLIEPDLILTAAHCVDRLRPVRVAWSDALPRIEAGKKDEKEKQPSVEFLTEEVKVVAMDRERDLALLRLPTKKTIPPLKVAPNVDSAKVGSPIVTIGHPARRATAWDAQYLFEKEEVYLVSSGIVSGLGEQDLLTDVSLTPGNSGGPLLNPAGEVIGVVSRKRVGPTVGLIGYAAHANSIAEFRAEHAKKGDEDIRWMKAGTNARVSLFWASLASKQAGVTGDRELWGARLDVDVWDRLRLSYAGSFSGNPSFGSYSLGWKFQFLRPDLNVWNVTPGVDFMSFRHDDPASGIVTELRRAGLSLTLESSVFPLSVKASFSPGSENSLGIVQVGLPFF